MQSTRENGLIGNAAGHEMALVRCFGRSAQQRFRGLQKSARAMRERLPSLTWRRGDLLPVLINGGLRDARRHERRATGGAGIVRNTFYRVDLALAVSAVDQDKTSHCGKTHYDCFLKNSVCRSQTHSVCQERIAAICRSGRPHHGLYTRSVMRDRLDATTRRHVLRRRTI